MNHLPLLAQTPQYVPWILATAIIVIGLFVIGLRDVSRFSLKRAWAISGVCFDESIRRRVLLIAPLAFVGVIIVSQLTRPFDEQDAIRQATKFSLFATGLVVAMVTIILAATNLPKEIDSRVIYTVVTKPITRLEIVLGKVMGFARVSATILLIMGVFTWSYLAFRAWSLQQGIHASLAAPDAGLSTVSRSTLEHYQEFGLLTAKSYEWPDALGVYARPPQGNERWLAGSAEAQLLVRFAPKPEQLLAPPGGSIAGTAVQLVAELGFDQVQALTPQLDPLAEFGVRGEATPPRTDVPTPLLAVRPRVEIAIMGPDGNRLFNQNEFAPPPIPLPRKPGEPVVALIPPEAVTKLAQVPSFYVQIVGISPGTHYRVTASDNPAESPVKLIVLGLSNNAPPRVMTTLTPSAPVGATQFMSFEGREGTFGQQLKGGKPGQTPIAVYSFREARPGVVNDGLVPFETRIGVERSSAEDYESDNSTILEIRVRDNASGQIGEPVQVRVESNRNVYFDVPAQLLSSGDFDLLVRNATPGHWVGLLPRSIQMVTADSFFGWNLLKSLGVLWLMSILVVIVAIFCSTFLSWPIAIVLSVVILLGHWGVQQVGGAGSGLGNQVANEWFPRGAAQARVVSQSVNALNTFMETVGSVLPDISRFSATEELERGVSVPLSRLGDAAKVAFGFGIPLMILAYVFLKNKEVAP